MSKIFFGITLGGYGKIGPTNFVMCRFVKCRQNLEHDWNLCGHHQRKSTTRREKKVHRLF